MTAAATNADTSVLAAFAQLVADKTPYVYGGVSQLGADCSGAVKWAFAQIGVTFAARTSQAQASLGAAVPLAGAGGLGDATAGDVLFFDEPGEGTDSHEALYAGGGMDYEESTPGTVARLIPVDTAHLAGIRQFVTAAGAPLAGITAAGKTGTGTTPTTPAAGAAPAAPKAATETSVFTALDPASWESDGAKLVFIAGALGLILYGASRTANPA